LLAGRKKVTRRDWANKTAVKFREGMVHLAYNQLPRVRASKRVGYIRIARPPYPERTRDIPDEDFELEGFKYMEERGILLQKKTPRQFFEDWRQSDQILFVVRFDLVFRCDRCSTWTTVPAFGPYHDKRLCPLCWVDWSSHADANATRAEASSASWEELYAEFCATERKEAMSWGANA